MHINPEMSGPVQFMTGKRGVVPLCVAFAGAEFIVYGTTTIQDTSYWHVVVEVCV